MKDSSSLIENKKSIDGGSFFEMNVDRGDLGSADSLRYNILVWVLEEKYDRAIQELKEFNSTPSEFPNFHEKVERFISHAIDLVYAIKAKRGFPGINSLTRAKQQELREKFREHFRELTHVLQIVEKVQADLRIQDVRSTIYVVKAVWYSVVAITTFAFMMEMKNGFFMTTLGVIDEAFGDFANYLSKLIGF